MRPDSSASCAALTERFARFVDEGKLSGFVAIGHKDDRRVYEAAYGKLDLARPAPMRMDAIFRAFSMTKAVTAAALMRLHEAGLWAFDDPVARFLPELEGMPVFRGLDAQGEPIVSPPRTRPTMAHLATHTAGFSYGAGDDPVDRAYRQAGIPFVPGGESSAAYLARVARTPLAFDPGTAWHYGIATDLQGIVVERLAGMGLRDLMKAELFDPLGMADTDFFVPEAKRDRFTALYGSGPEGEPAPVADGPFASTYAAPPAMASGGGGLVTTAADFSRFGRMLLGGGALDGRRVLTRASVAAILRNQLPSGLRDIGRPGLAFGVNGSIVSDPALAGQAVGKGTYAWDGAAGTWFWVDPENETVFVGLVQKLDAPEVKTMKSASQRAMMAIG